MYASQYIFVLFLCEFKWKMMSRMYMYEKSFASFFINAAFHQHNETFFPHIHALLSSRCLAV